MFLLLKLIIMQGIYCTTKRVDIMLLFFVYLISLFLQKCDFTVGGGGVVFLQCVEMLCQLVYSKISKVSDTCSRTRRARPEYVYIQCNVKCQPFSPISIPRKVICFACRTIQWHISYGFLILENEYTCNRILFEH